MDDESGNSGGHESSVLRTLRLVAAFAIGLLGVLALLFVFDVIPRDALQALAVKVLLVALIVAAAGGGIALLLGTRR